MRTLGLDFTAYHHKKVFEEVFFLQKQLDYKNAIQEFCEHLEIQSYNLEELDAILQEGLQHNNIYPDTIPFLEHLSGLGLKTCILSNTDYLSWFYLNRDYNVGQYVDFTLTSYNTGIMKPDPAIFELACRVCGVNKTDAAMIGDSLEDDYQASIDFGIGSSVLLNRKGKYEFGVTSLMEVVF